MYLMFITFFLDKIGEKFYKIIRTKLHFKISISLIKMGYYNDSINHLKKCKSSNNLKIRLISFIIIILIKILPHKFLKKFISSILFI